MRPLLCLALLSLLAACAGSGTRVKPADCEVVFQINPDADGKLQRIAVVRVLDAATRRPVVFLPSALFVKRARDALAERDWVVAYDEAGAVQPVFATCDLTPRAPDTPRCSR